MEKIEVLIKQYFEDYNEYLDSTIEYPDEADADFRIFRESEKEILEFFNIPQRKYLNALLYRFIEDSCYEKKNICTKKIINQIITSLKRVEQISFYLPKMDGLFKDLFKAFNESPLLSCDNLPELGGVYVIYEKLRVIYVGHSNNIRKRIQWYTRSISGGDGATFTVNIAKQDYKKVNGLKRKRYELMQISDFLEFYENHKINLKNAQFRCIRIESDILQIIFEPYLAIKLGTYPITNTFNNP